VDRAKDLVKSGGEWIVFRWIGNTLMSHPPVTGSVASRLPPPQVAGSGLLRRLVLREGATPYGALVREFFWHSRLPVGNCRTLFFVLC